MTFLINSLKLISILSLVLLIGCGNESRSERESDKIKTVSEKEIAPKAQNHNKIDVDIFMHDSKSMNGFRFVGSQFGNEIHSFFNKLEDPQNQLISSIKSFLLKMDSEIKINSLGGGINKLADHIDQANKIDGNSNQILKGVNKDYSKMLDAVINQTMKQPNGVSAFISDLVYYPGDAEGKNLQAYLTGQSQRVRTTFQTVLSKYPDLCLILLRGVSDYRWDKKDSQGRPFYLIFVGRKKDLQPVMGFAQKNWPGKYFWFELIKSTSTPKVIIAREHNWAKGTYKSDHQNENLIKEPCTRGNSPFSFVSEVELNSFNGIEYLVTDSRKYKGADWTVEKIGKEPKYLPNMEEAYQFEISTKGNLNPSQFEIKLPYSLPTWIPESSHIEYPCGPISDPKYSGKTFGFDPLINGIVDAYHIGEKDLLQLNFRITK